MEMTSITWPTSTAGKLLPAPKSTTGKFSYDKDDTFFVYDGNTTKADYAEYVNTCSEAGFNVDYSKDDKYYRADNAEGWQIELRYEGNNVMSVSIKAPSKETEGVTSSSDTNTQTPADTEKDTSDAGVLRADFKEAMDSYERFMGEYVDFMKKYKANPTDMNLLASYADYMSRYAEFVADFSKWQDKDMNAAEAAYYLEVQTRVNKKLKQH